MKNVSNLNNELLPVIILAGPTAIGKTNIAIKLAKKINAEILSADSRQMYQFMDIGTAKPNSEQLGQVKHHFINTLSPNQVYSAGKFGNDARKCIDSMRKINKNIIICGGSGMYIQAVLGMIFKSSKTNQILRKSIETEALEKGWDFLYKELVNIDPIYANKINPNDKKRISRAIEIFRSTDKTPTMHFDTQSSQFSHPYLYFTLNAPRKLIHERINLRVDEMIKNGLVDEVKLLNEMGFSSEDNALNTVGYKEVFAYLNGHLSMNDMIEEIKAHSRQYAKRQLTWFRKYTEHYWLMMEDFTQQDKVVEKIMELSRQKILRQVMEIKI